MTSIRIRRTPLNQALAQARLASCACLASWALLASSQAGAVMLDLGTFPGATGSVQAQAISGDGQVVVGRANGSSIYLYRWSAGQGFTQIGAALSSPFGWAYGVNQNGSVVVGASPIGTGGNVRAFRWTQAGLTDLGTLGGLYSLAYGVSDSGDVVVGYSLNSTGQTQAFRWEGGTMQGLNAAAGDTASIAYGVSGDGQVIVGQSGSDPVFWSAGNSVTVIGTNGWANAANQDGSVVVGKQASSAFRWTDATGIQNLGTLGGSTSEAKGVNADGSVVVGSAKQADGNDRAFRWTDATGMTNLGVLTGAQTSSANGVSDDGHVVVGTSGQRAFIWSDRSGGIQDLAHLQHSQLSSAETLEHLTAAQNRRLRELGHEQCLPEGEHTRCLSAGLSGYTGEADHHGTQQIGQLAAGWRTSDQVAVGVNANLGRADLNTEAALQDRAYGLALWAAYHQQPHELGWSASASVAAGRSQNHFERGVGLQDVQHAKSHTRMNSTAVRLAVGYGLHAGASVITPELALSHARTEHDGFTERNVAFPLTLEHAGSRETFATVGLHSATPLSPKANLHLGVAVDALLKEQTDAIEGHSAVPGLQHFHLHSDVEKRRWVPIATLGYSYTLSQNAQISGQVQAEASTYEHQQPVYGLGVNYHYSF